MTNKERLGVLTLAFVCGSIAASPLFLSSCEKKPQKAAEKEFVCYDDGKLVERHVGVKHASRRVDSTAWRITYVEGQVAYYTQPAGETCQVEIVE